MEIIFHPAAQRGHANFGWLDTYRTFNFGDYYHPERKGLGSLLVVNDDVVAPGRGFPTHSHSNMEIITIALEGELEHKDSMGNTSLIRAGDIQIMSAGTGIEHSEYNKSQKHPAHFLQIWILPYAKDVEPCYDQITIEPWWIHNQFELVLSGDPDNGISIYQHVWFYLGKFTNDQTIEHYLDHIDYGTYIFMIEGQAKVQEKTLSRRDGLAFYNIHDAPYDSKSLKIELEIKANSYILLMQFPI